jgi:ACS family hexuronate transporter-like MFS transporter
MSVRAELEGISIERAWAISIVATLTMTVSYLDRQTLAAIAPRVTTVLRIDEEAYGWLQSAFSMAYLVGAPLAGRWIDRAGARRGLPLSMLLWSVIAAAHSFAPGYVSLLVLRILLGLAESPGFPGAAQSVQRALPASMRSAGFGVLFTGSSIGAAIAGPLAIGIMNAYHWRASFVGTALVGLAWIPLWLVTSSQRGAAQALDTPVEATPVAARGALPAREVIGHPAVLRAMVVVAATSPMMAFMLLWLPKYMVATQHIPQERLGGYLWLPPLLFDLGSVLFGALGSLSDSLRARRDRPHHLLFAMALALGASVLALRTAHGAWTAVVVAGVASAGGGAIFALVTADMLSRVSPRVVSAAGGMTAAAQSLAYIVANPAIGRMVRLSHSYRPPLMLVAVLLIAAALAWFLWPPPPRHAIS